MNCPKCTSDTRVVKTTSAVVGRAEIRIRDRECKCGMRYQSQEKITKSYNPPATHRQIAGKPPATFPGSYSDPILSLPCVSDPDPDPSFVTLQSVDPARESTKRGRGDAADYPVEFESLWDGCKGKKGNKLPAFKSWKKNKPPLDLTKQRWALWMTTIGWQDGYSQHLSTWLNERGWENEPDPAQFARRASGTRSVAGRADNQETIDAVKEWISK
jgi:hypothetical protein